MRNQPLVVGNWKMNGTSVALAEIKAIALGAQAVAGRVEVGLCLPATLITRGYHAVPDARIGNFPHPILRIGAQDVDAAPDGAHTGCISAAMILDASATMTIVGHSERRAAQGETDTEVRAKATAALEAGLAVILCIGESLDVREAGHAIATVSDQLDASLPADDKSVADRLSVAYEPIWAIGTGKVPSTSDIAEMHAALRDRLVAAFGEPGRKVRILYGGSVKGSNAADIFAVPDVDGALVGGASLTAADFLPIVDAAAAALAPA